MEREVSYVDSERITHSVTVSADSLFEACIRALAAFRKRGLSEPGRPSEITVKVSQPSTRHTIPVGSQNAVISRISNLRFQAVGSGNDVNGW